MAKEHGPWNHVFKEPTSVERVNLLLTHLGLWVKAYANMYHEVGPAEPAAQTLRTYTMESEALYMRWCDVARPGETIRVALPGSVEMAAAAGAANKQTREQILHACFDLLWLQLSQAGRCDDIGGSEYRRLRADWLSEGAPCDVGRWLRDALLVSNRSPGTAPPGPGVSGR